jgi:TetR/AcrR family tetracycline transcriptional repressor
MRRLAAELGVDPMAIYYHLPGKRAVLSGLIEDVFAELRVPSAGGTWRDRVRGWARAYRDLARAHPNLVLHLVSNAEAGATAALEASERSTRHSKRRDYHPARSCGRPTWWWTTSTGSP